MEKEINNMGKITFDNYYNPHNKKILNMNKSPIKEHKRVMQLNRKDAIKLIDNEYIFNLLKTRKKYQLFECSPTKLLSSYRYDIFIKYYFVKSYIENRDIDLAQKIYLDHIKAFNNFKEPDGKKNTLIDFIEHFKKLIDSLKCEGFTKTVIPISKTGIPIDGAHRLSIALYFDYKVPYIVFDLLDGEYNRDFFIKRGMKMENIEIIDNIANNFAEKEK